MDNSEKFLNMLGLARRAGKLECGFDGCMSLVKAGKAKGIISAFDISQKTLDNLAYEAEKKNTEILKVKHSKEELSFATGKRAGLFALMDEGFFKKLKELSELSDK